ncbi:hypothetical protein AAVH_31722 [Aphelenchoides avenae]|nr:hypothetical protein AAVH_31722 [Aphelenchus avenae]
MTKLAVPHLEKTHGSIVNVSSVGSTRMLPHAVYYACTKAALDQYTRHCALQYGAKGIRVNSINPGPVETNIYDRHNDSDDARVALEDWVSNATIMKRYGRCHEMTPIILLLASDEASYVTGANWLIDGGYTANMKPVEFASS